MLYPMFRYIRFRRFLYLSRHNFCSGNASTSTVDEKEVNRFSALANEWWSDDGPMKPLRSMNRLRVPWIRDTLHQIRRQRGQEVELSASLPLSGFHILDVGCGAGFLTEPLARLGANVVGIDPSLENILVAREHAAGRKEELGYEDRLVYHTKTVEELAGESTKGNAQEGQSNLFDAVIASEVLEHVSSRETFVENCLRLAKPNGGCLFFTTINRTILSRLLAIFVAENVLRIVPHGLHDWEKFTPPDDLQFLLEKNNDCLVRLVHGMAYNPLTNTWFWIRDTSVNYALCAVKKDQPSSKKRQWDDVVPIMG